MEQSSETEMSFWQLMNILFVGPDNLLASYLTSDQIKTNDYYY